MFSPDRGFYPGPDCAPLIGLYITVDGQRWKCTGQNDLHVPYFARQLKSRGRFIEWSKREYAGEALTAEALRLLPSIERFDRALARIGASDPTCVLCEMGDEPGHEH